MKSSLALSFDWEKICRTLGLSYTKRSTGVLVTLCPFHNEKTPSMHLWQESGDYRCHGCGHTGNQAQFMAKVLGVAENHPEIWNSDIYRLVDIKGQLLLSLTEGHNPALF